MLSYNVGCLSWTCAFTYIANQAVGQRLVCWLVKLSAACYADKKIWIIRCWCHDVLCWAVRVCCRTLMFSRSNCYPAMGPLKTSCMCDQMVVGNASYLSKHTVVVIQDRPLLSYSTLAAKEWTTDCRANSDNTLQRTRGAHDSPRYSMASYMAGEGRAVRTCRMRKLLSDIRACGFAVVVSSHGMASACVKSNHEHAQYGIIANRV